MNWLDNGSCYLWNLVTRQVIVDILVLLLASSATSSGSSIWEFYLGDGLILGMGFSWIWSFSVWGENKWVSHPQ